MVEIGIDRKELVKEWVKALRSGEYKQGTGCLKKEDSFCCLGVVCDLVAKQGYGKWKLCPFDNVERFHIGVNAHPGILPVPLRRHLGMASSAVAVSRSTIEKALGPERGKDFFNTQLTLVDFNDEGATFEEIADIIELEFLGDEDDSE